MMTTSGGGTFFDGATSARHAVTVDLAPDVLRIRATDGTLLGEWPYDKLEAVPAPEGVLRLGQAGSPVLARLEIRDRELAHEIDNRSLPVDRSGRGERRMRAKVIVWSLVATASLVGVAVWGVPRIATRLTPLIPYALELRLGELIEAQARASLDTRHAGAAFECGNAAKEKPGRAAFDKLMNQLETAAGLPIPLRPLVVRQPEANAIALPGGYIYVFQGLIDKAENARRARRRHRARGRPCRPPRRHASGAAGGRAFAAVRYVARRFRRRRRRGLRRQDHTADQL